MVLSRDGTHLAHDKLPQHECLQGALDGEPPGDSEQNGRRKQAKDGARCTHTDAPRQRDNGGSSSSCGRIGLTKHYGCGPEDCVGGLCDRTVGDSLVFRGKRV